VTWPTPADDPATVAVACRHLHCCFLLRLPQVLRQVAKLEDVLAVRQHPAGHAVFGRVAEFFEPAGA
jgi:hypothetical protein